MAKRFIFRFETMLKLRRQQEDHHKRIVGARMTQIAEVRDQIARLEQQARDETDDIRQRTAQGTIDLTQLVRHRHWLGQLNRNTLDAQTRLRTLEARLAQERVQLAEAVKRRRILEKLRERQAEQHQKEADRRETRELDEIGTMRFGWQ